MKRYADRDVVALGQLYVDHVRAMTKEGLHAKSDIAAELAWRDEQIAELLALVACAVGVLQRHILPEGGPSDHDALNELYGIFDGPEYRAAIAKTEGRS